MWIIFLNSIRQYGLSAIILLLGTFLTYEYLDIRHLREKLLQCEADNFAFQYSNARLINTLKNQNTAILFMQKEAARRQAAAQKAILKAQMHAEKFQQEADEINAIKVDRGECADLVSVLNDYFRKR